MDFEQFIKKYNVHYTFITLRYQQKKTYKEIADQFHQTPSCVREKCHIFLHSLFLLYIKYLISVDVILNEWKISDFYQSAALSVAYLESTYKEYLNIFRHGAPSVIPENHITIPTFRKITKEELLILEQQILVAREQQKRTYSDIGKELDLSGEKVKCIYSMYYHKKILMAIDRIRPTVNFSISNYIFHNTYSSYKRWHIIASEYTELVKDLID